MSNESDAVVDERRPPLRVPAILGLLVIVTLEFLAVAGITVVFVVDLVVDRPDAVASAVAIIVLSAIAALWLAFIVLGLARGRSWSRGATVVWQFVQIAVGISCLEGVVRTPSVGWALIVPALVALVLVFSPPVTRVLARRER